MAYVEAGSGPTASNNSGGGHYGIYQAGRDRQQHFGGSSDFDAQLNAIVTEKKSTEARSHRLGLAAKTPHEAAVSASAFERGERYNPATGEDMWVGKTEAGIPTIHRIVTTRALTAPPPHTMDKPSVRAPEPSAARPATTPQRLPVPQAKPVSTAPVKVTVNRATGANPTTAVAAAAAAQ